MTTQRPLREANRADARLLALLLLGETLPVDAATGTGITTGGTIEFGLVGLRAGDVITNVISSVTTAGVTLTIVRLGLYNTSGNRLAQTADVKADFASTGVKVEPLTATYTIPSTDGYYLAIITTGTTQPIFERGLSSSTMYNAIGSGVRRYAIQAAQTDLTNPATLANTTTGGIWLAVS